MVVQSIEPFGLDQKATITSALSGPLALFLDELLGLIVLPTVRFGGVSIFFLLIGDPTYIGNPLRQDLWRAGGRRGDRR
jgi:hypothetical protein